MKFVIILQLIAYVSLFIAHVAVGRALHFVGHTRSRSLFFFWGPRDQP